MSNVTMSRKNIQNIAIVFVVSALIIFGLTKWVQQKQQPTALLTDDNGKTQKIDAPLSPEILQSNNQPIVNMANPTATFTTNKGRFEIELFEDQMPITVGNFIKLANEGFYDGTKFHRVIDGFMIQGGDPNSKGSDTSKYGQGGPGYSIQDEFVAGEHLTNKRGAIAMANTGQPNSGGSQFFIDTVDNINLDFNVPDPNNSQHPVFGHVIKGMDVVDTISKSETDANNVPVDPVIVESVKINTAN